MSAEAFNQLFAELSAEYRRSLPEKFTELDALCAELTPDSLLKLQRELHTLVGTAKTMGLPAVTDAARVAEVFLEPWFAQNAVPPPATQIEFNQLLAALKRTAEQV